MRKLDAYGVSILLGVAAHFFVGICVWVYLRDQSGLLPGSDEARNFAIAEQLAGFWREGRWPQWSTWNPSDTNFGYYHLLASLEVLGIDGPALPRFLNVVLGLLAIWLWHRALAIKREDQAVRRTFVAIALFTPSLMLWSSLVLKEAVIYSAVAAHFALMAHCFATRTLSRANLVAAVLVLLALSYLRNYTAILLWVLASAFLMLRLSWRAAAVYCLTAAAAMIALNPNLLPLVARFMFGQDLYIRLLDWLLGQGPLISTTAFKSGAEYLDLVAAETSVGGSAVDPATPFMTRLWLFVSFPLPWQARSALQWFAVPEVLIFMLLLPAALYGLYLKLESRDTFAIYVAAFVAASLTSYLVFVSNLGTLYRAKSALMFPFAYFVAVGVDGIWSRVAAGSQQSRAMPDL